MKAVANAGPLIALGKLGLVHLLKPLHDQVLVPSIVYEEVVTRGVELGQPDAYLVQMAVARHDLLVVDLAKSETETTEQAGGLHSGELAAIALATQEGSDWLLLDDQLARERAHALGLRVKGTLGVIVEAHRRGLLTDEEVELIFEAIIARDDIWISDMLVRRVREAWRQRFGRPHGA